MDNDSKVNTKNEITLLDSVQHTFLKSRTQSSNFFSCDYLVIAWAGVGQEF